jgi:hypothetical protein
VTCVVEGNRPAAGAMRSHRFVRRLGVVALAALTMGCGSTAGVRPADPGASGAAATAEVATGTEPNVDVPAEVLAADDPLFVAMGLPDDPDEVQRILKGRHERLVDACMAAHGYEMYVPEADDNTDGHLNAETMNALSPEDRQGWLQAWRGSAGDADPGCVDQFNEQVYPLAGIPELGPYLTAISDDPQFIEAGSVYDACMLNYPIRADGTRDPRTLDECIEPLDEVRHTVYREQVLEFLRLHHDEVQEFGRSGASL